jgi:CelD/BcsL family acetyltransferase involved in cellulose biosynthesis
MLLDPALDALDPASAVTLIEARDESGLLIARMPVVEARRHGRFPVRHAANWVHRHCFYGAPLLRQGAEQQGWAGLLRTLDAARWSGPFLHLRGIDPDGPAFAALRAVCAAEGRRCEEVGRYERAMLRSNLDAAAYWTANVRAKKRKELRRLQSRLAEEGEIVRRHLADPSDLPDWIDAFLTLEAKGWKGEQGTALGSRSEDAVFLRQACTRAQEAGQLDMLRIDCSGKAIAMLINFTGAAGGFSFKIAIDPDYARYSPGVLIEQDNLARMLDDHVAPWMDSCAAPDHPMIDSLWGERRAIAQYRIALRKPGPGGHIGRLLLPAMTLIEQGYARIKSGVRT